MRSLTAKQLSPLLAPFIKSLHYHEANFPFALERIVPNGQAHLMVNLGEDEFRYYKSARTEHMVRHSGAVLVGPHSRSTIIDTHERLLEAPDAHAKFRVFEELLLQFLTPNADPAIQYALSALQSGLPLSQVASGAGLLPRTLQRRFSSQVGMTPKRWARVRRLQKVLRAVRRSTQPIWHDLAADYGDADQAHLVHEFRELADITPSGCQPHSDKRSNHLPISHD